MNTTNLRFRSNRVRDIISLFHEELDGVYGSGEVGVFIGMLFEAFLGWDKVWLLTSKEQTIDQSDLLRFHWALEDLKKHSPIQHIIGYTEFCGCRINVSPDVLIPRPETEEMVEKVVGHTPQSLRDSSPNLGEQLNSILDLCTGSGCIAIALKKAFPGAEVTAVDISSAALDIARQNAQNNNVKVRFVQGDVLTHPDRFAATPPEEGMEYNLIVSNPPYVRERERAAMQANVLDHEPGLALFVPDDDPLCFYRAIARIAQQQLAKEGLLVVEINEALADETCAVFATAGLKSVVYKDFRGKSRWLTARFE